MENKKISVKDIARMAGTSVATVSRVINQNGRFSKETEQRVREIIEKYDYKPNQLARGLRISHARAVGLMVPDITNEFFARITREVQKNLLMHNYVTLICNSNEDVKEAKDQIEMFMSYKVSGIIYIGGENIIESQNIPTLYIDRDPRDIQIKLSEEHAMIECDNIQGGYLAGRELLQKGVRNPRVVGYNVNLSTIRKRIDGFRKAFEDAEIALSENLFIDVKEVSMQEGARVTKEILEDADGADGIFFTSDVLAIGGIEYLKKAGVKIPQEMKIVGFDDISAGQIIDPNLTTIHQPIEKFGELAADVILSMIEKKEMETNKYRIPVELVVRQTT